MAIRQEKYLPFVYLVGSLFVLWSNGTRVEMEVKVYHRCCKGRTVRINFVSYEN